MQHPPPPVDVEMDFWLLSKLFGKDPILSLKRLRMDGMGKMKKARCLLEEISTVCLPT